MATVICPQKGQCPDYGARASVICFFLKSLKRLKDINKNAISTL